jgi:hypothetical protein
MHLLPLLLSVALLINPARSDLDLLAERLTGHFSSERQSVEQLGYFDIHLHSVRIWPGRTDGIWIYVEQAMATALEKPYRQRIYMLVEEPNGTLASVVYELPEPAAFVGVWAEPARFAQLTPQQLYERVGCNVWLTKNERGEFVGSTIGTGCGSILNGAAYATSEVVIDGNGMSTWDRGYNDKGEQVWGATEGPYRFDRVE